MDSSSVFGISGQALELAEERASILSNNIVNSSTPHYKAKDIDFHKILQQSNHDANTTALETTHSNHIAIATNLNGGPEEQYRVPMQKSLDGNTVDEEMERKNFIENALNYQVNLTFIQNKTDQLMQAIKGA